MINSHVIPFEQYEWSVRISWISLGTGRAKAVLFWKKEKALLATKVTCTLYTVGEEEREEEQEKQEQEEGEEEKEEKEWK